MLFVRVVRKKLNGKKALLMFEIPKNKHLLKKVFTCTSFCEFLSFDLQEFFKFTYIKSGGIGSERVQKGTK